MMIHIAKLKKILYILLLISIIQLLYSYVKFSNIYIKKDNIFNNDGKSIIKPFYNHGQLTKNLTCSQFFESNFIFDNKTRVSRNFPNESLSVTCESIKKRRYFTSVSLSDEEKNFPLAYSFIIYKDYEFLELILSLIYQPQNIYCFAIDKKQPFSFKFKIHSLADCFDNVFVSDKEYTLSSGGSHYSTSHTECIKKIKKYDWKYIFLLQNHDFPIKTNAELVKILKKFEGTSDFKAASGKKKLLSEKLDWTFGGLNIFPNTTFIDKKILNTEIKLGKGYSEVTLSRETVNYIMDVLNITTYQNNFDNYHKFANDEVFWSSLLSNYEYLKIPGSIPTHCIHKKEAMKSFTRFSKWHYGNKKPLCPSGYKRHSICIIGLEYIKNLELIPFFFANKLMDTFDAGAVDCWGERIFNKTFFPKKYKEVDLSPYLSRLQLRFQKFLQKSSNISQFICT